MIYSFVPYVGIVTCVSFLVHLTVIKYHKLSGLKQGKFILPQFWRLLLLLLLLSGFSRVRLCVTP